MEKIVSTAKVIDGVLILTLPDAIRPVVWQMQLGQTKSSALEVREQNGNWVLYLKTPRMDVMEIAPFATKDSAVRALLAVSKAMEKAHGHFTASSSYPVPAVIPGQGRFGGFLRFLKTLGMIVLSIIVAIALILGALSILRPSEYDPNAALPGSSSPSSSAETGATAPSQVEIAPAGQAVPADEFLNAQ